MADERMRLIEQAITEKYKKYADKIIELVKALPEEYRQSGDSPWKNVWEEWVDQVQHQHSVFYELYEEQIRALCTSVINEMSDDEITLLWAGRDPLHNDDMDDDELDGFVVLGQMKFDLQDELFRLVNEVAVNEELEIGDY